MEQSHANLFNPFGIDIKKIWRSYCIIYADQISATARNQVRDVCIETTSRDERVMNAAIIAGRAPVHKQFRLDSAEESDSDSYAVCDFFAKSPLTGNPDDFDIVNSF